MNGRFAAEIVFRVTDRRGQEAAARRQLFFGLIRYSSGGASRRRDDNRVIEKISRMPWPTLPAVAAAEPNVPATEIGETDFRGPMQVLQILGREDFARQCRENGGLLAANCPDFEHPIVRIEIE